MATPFQRLGQVRAYKAGGTCNEHLLCHSASLPGFVAVTQWVFAPDHLGGCTPEA
jgi:hypothetical protein